MEPAGEGSRAALAGLWKPRRPTSDRGDAVPAAYRQRQGIENALHQISGSLRQPAPEAATPPQGPTVNILSCPRRVSR